MFLQSVPHLPGEKPPPPTPPRASYLLKTGIAKSLQQIGMRLGSEYCPAAARVPSSPPASASPRQFKCCGSNSSADWLQSSYILSPEAEGRRVPDSCCKTVVARCGQRAHPSNIYKVEVSGGSTEPGKAGQVGGMVEITLTL